MYNDLFFIIPTFHYVVNNRWNSDQVSLTSNPKLPNICWVYHLKLYYSASFFTNWVPFESIIFYPISSHKSLIIVWNALFPNCIFHQVMTITSYERLLLSAPMYITLNLLCAISLQLIQRHEVAIIDSFLRTTGTYYVWWTWILIDVDTYIITVLYNPNNDQDLQVKAQLNDEWYCLIGTIINKDNW